MTTIDAHQHFWTLGRRNHTWPPAVAGRLDRDFTPADLSREMRAADVDAAILMQSLNDYDETIEFLNLAAHFDWICGVVGWVPLSSPEATRRAIDGLPHRKKLVGIRHLINFEPDPEWLLNDRVQACVDVIAASGLVFDCVPNDTARFEAVLATIEKRPQMSVVIDHLARPPVLEAAWEPWASLLCRAARLPNVSIKLSVGLDIAMGWTWSNDALRRYVDHVVETFGPSRIMAASNWPVSTLAGSYSQVWSGTRELICELSLAEQKSILADTAVRVFGLDINAARSKPQGISA